MKIFSLFVYILRAKEGNKIEKYTAMILLRHRRRATPELIWCFFLFIWCLSTGIFSFSMQILLETILLYLLFFLILVILGCCKSTCDPNWACKTFDYLLLGLIPCALVCLFSEFLWILSLSLSSEFLCSVFFLYSLLWQCSTFNLHRLSIFW